MKYPMDVPVKIVQLGAGGTGGHIAPHLYRLLYALGRPARYIICDGDKVEEKNLLRQNFSPADLGENKARVLAERYSTVFGLEAEYVPAFIEKLETLMELIQSNEWELDENPYKKTKEMVILLGAVDNNKSRQLCHQALFNYLRINYQAIHHIQAKIQDTVNRQETFRNREPLIRRIIQRPLKPLRRRCNRRI